MIRFINNVTYDVVAVGHAMTRIFWEVVDEAQQTRSRLRLRRGLGRLVERQTDRYERLGQMGYELLHDGVAVERTQETLKVLAEIDRLQTEQQGMLDRRDPALEISQPFPWHRLESALHSGEWVVHVTPLPQSSPWCGRPMTGVPPPVGLCVAVKRGQTVRPASPATICAGGDLLIILSPVGAVSDWDRWLAYGVPTNQARPES